MMMEAVTGWWCRSKTRNTTDCRAPLGTRRGRKDSRQSQREHGPAGHFDFKPLASGGVQEYILSHLVWGSLFQQHQDTHTLSFCEALFSCLTVHCFSACSFSFHLLNTFLQGQSMALYSFPPVFSLLAIAFIFIVLLQILMVL